MSSSEWQAVKLGDVFDVNPRRIIPKGTITPFIPMELLPVNARSVGNIYHREFNGSGVTFINGDTLLARITPCLENGKTAFINCLREHEIGHGSTEYIVIAGKDQITDGLFAYYLTRSPEFRSYAISHMEGTSGRQRVPTESVRQYELLLPPLSEQKRIAEILGSLDDKIELNRRMNETLESIARVIFKSWFVDFDPVRAKMEGRQPVGMDAETAALFPDHFEDSALGPIPAGWRVKPIDGIASFLNGLALQKYPAKGEEYLPAIKIAQMHKGNSEGADRVSKSIPKEYWVKNGDVLFSWSGSLEVMIWHGGDGALNQHLFKVDSKEYPKWFYYYCLREFLPEFQQIAAGKATTMGHIQRHHLSSSLIATPPEEFFFPINQYINPYLECIANNNLETHNLASIRDGLLPKLLGGGNI